MDPVVEETVKFLAVFIALVATSVFGANPSFRSFSPSDFTTNGYVIRLKPSTSFLPNLSFDVFMDEHFGCGRNSSAQIGKYGWTQVASTGGGAHYATYANHWGVMGIATVTNLGSSQGLFNAEAISTRPNIAPINASTGWTNRIVWRLVGTNALRMWIAMTDATSFGLGAGARQDTLGIFMDTTNSPNIRGYTTTTATAGTTTETNLAVIVSGQWYTNEFFSFISGVICFTHNGGSLACVSNNITTAALIPAFAVTKTVGSTETNLLEIDDWFIYRQRSP